MSAEGDTVVVQVRATYRTTYSNRITMSRADFERIERGLDAGKQSVRWALEAADLLDRHLDMEDEELESVDDFYEVKGGQS